MVYLRWACLLPAALISWFVTGCFMSFILTLSSCDSTRKLLAGEKQDGFFQPLLIFTIAYAAALWVTERVAPANSLPLAIYLIGGVFTFISLASAVALYFGIGATGVLQEDYRLMGLTLCQLAAVVFITISTAKSKSTNSLP